MAVRLLLGTNMIFIQGREPEQANRDRHESRKYGRLPRPPLQYPTVYA